MGGWVAFQPLPPPSPFLPPPAQVPPTQQLKGKTLPPIKSSPVSTHTLHSLKTRGGELYSSPPSLSPPLLALPLRMPASFWSLRACFGWVGG